jgi:hypothetical protein
MKTLILDNVISEKELFFMYQEVISHEKWSLIGQSTIEKNTELNAGPLLKVKDEDKLISNYAFAVWGQSIVYRIAKLLEDKNIAIPTDIYRMWFNATYHGKKTQHWFHTDDEKDFTTKSIMLFMTPLWQPDWKGSFYVDGEEFKFKPGSAVIFDSKEFHKGESPDSELYNWQRLTCNILVKTH